ncbi:hypothetical protein MMC32_001249 [Xylographa parallela]|nr:hypothetical protein [Xylographa parallela]
MIVAASTLVIDHEGVSDAAWIMDNAVRVQGDVNPRPARHTTSGGGGSPSGTTSLGSAPHDRDEDPRTKDSRAGPRRISVPTVYGRRSGPLSNAISWEVPQNRRGKAPWKWMTGVGGRRVWMEDSGWWMADGGVATRKKGVAGPGRALRVSNLVGAPPSSVRPLAPKRPRNALSVPKGRRSAHHHSSFRCFHPQTRPRSLPSGQPSDAHVQSPAAVLNR